MTFFLKNGARFRVTTKEALDLHERLPVGTYTVGFDDCTGQFFLEQIDAFEVTGKLYGSTNRHANRILRTFNDRTASTGVLLAGEKGSGKTLLAKCISIKAAEGGVPTIVINKNWHGEAFNGFLQKIEQPTVVLFDEYEKVYHNPQEQEKMLTLLDGVYPSKKLFLLTCNDKWRIDSNMRNRPGRIFYHLDFHGLDKDFIREYCEDNLAGKEHIPAIVAISGLFSAFNFDMLKGMVEDMNRYDESPAQVLKYLNVRPEFSGRSQYNVELQMGSKDSADVGNVQSQWGGNPIKQDVHISYTRADGDKKKKTNRTAKFNVRHLETLDARADTYVFVNEDGARLTLTPAKTSFAIDYDALKSMILKDSLVTGLPPRNGGNCTDECDLLVYDDTADY